MKDWHHILQKWAEIYLEKTAKDKYYPLKKYYILREILGKPEDDPEVLTLQKNLIQEILANQLENGSWGDNLYNYEEGTTHQVMTLLDLGVNAKDEPIQRAADYMFSFQTENGPFTQKKPSCGVEANIVPTNAVVMALARSGYADDPRVFKAYNWLTTWQQEDGSIISPDAQRRKTEGGYPDCYCGIHQTCNVLLGLSTSEAMQKSEAAARGVNYLLGLCGYKYEIASEGIEPPLYRYMKEPLIPFEGAWHDPRTVPPHVGFIPKQDVDRKVEVFTTQHVLGTLCVLGCGLNNKKVKKGHDRLLERAKADDISLETFMAVKGLHQPFSVFSFHGH